MKKMVAISVFALAALSACADPDGDRLRKEKEAFDFTVYKRSIENCLNSGGSVIRSAWDLRMIDCVKIKNATNSGGK